MLEIKSSYRGNEKSIINDPWNRIQEIVLHEDCIMVYIRHYESESNPDLYSELSVKIPVIDLFDIKTGAQKILSGLTRMKWEDKITLPLPVGTRIPGHTG